MVEPLVEVLRDGLAMGGHTLAEIEWRSILVSSASASSLVRKPPFFGWRSPALVWAYQVLPRR